MPPLLVLLPLLAAQAEAAAGAPAARVERRLVAMGTGLRLEVEAPTRPAALAASEAAVRAIEAVEARLSTWRDDSELARLNRHPVGEPFAASPALLADLAAARALHEATGGAFDPGVGALVEAWGLRAGGRRPSDAELAGLRGGATLAHLALDLDAGTATRRHAALVVEEGAFGKGVGLDAALAALEAAGATRGWVDLGGQAAVLAAPGDAPVRFAVADPRDRARAAVELELAGGSLATTGNAERGVVVDGERLTHVLDPRTARPAADFGSVTVVAPDATTADALSTAYFVLGPDEALARAASRPGVDALVLEPDGPRLRARATAGLRGRVHVLRPEVDLVPPRPDGPDALDR